jgi:hypothetical protein
MAGIFWLRFFIYSNFIIFFRFLSKIDNKPLRRGSYMLVFLCLVLLGALVPMLASKFWFSIVTMILNVISKLWIIFAMYNDKFMKATLSDE